MMFSSEPVSKYYDSRLDGGPVYTEFNADWIIVEPWNAISSLVIALPAIYFAIKLYPKYKTFPFLSLCIPLLFLNGIGSTLFHAFRATPAFLFLDALPAAILTLAVGVHFWTKVLPFKWMAWLVVFSALMLRLVVGQFFAPHTAINISYGITGILMFLPMVIYLKRTNYYKIHFIIISVISLILALFFREADAWPNQFLPMGTHFLWHVFSGIGGFYLASYLYDDRIKTLKTRGEYSVVKTSNTPQIGIDSQRSA